MRIALISTPFVSVPPPLYGGTELFVSNLATELVKKGHDVFLFATGDSSIPGAKIGYLFESAQWPPNEETERLHLEAALAWIQTLEKNGTHFDIIHWNSVCPQDFIQQALSQLKARSVVTLHNALDQKTIDLIEHSDHAHYVLISHRQKDLLLEKSKSRSDFENVRVIHHGLDPNQYWPRTNVFYKKKRSKTVFFRQIVSGKRSEHCDSCC